MRSPDKSAHLGVCAAAYFVAALGLFAPRDVLHAQGRNEPALAQSIESLVARLPGRVVPLASLIDAALRDGFDAQLAVANRRRAEATAFYEGRAIDPVMHLSSDVASTPLTNLTASSMSQGTTAGIEAATPWGTVLSADVARAGTLGATRFLSSSDAARFTVGVTQPLLDGLNQRTALWRAAQLERTGAVAQVTRTRQEVVTGIELQYWSLAEAQAVEAVYNRSVELAQDILRRNEELASRDLIANVDVLTVRSGVAFRESLYTQARQVRREQSDALLFAAYGAAAAQLVDADTLPVLAVDNTMARIASPTLDEALRMAMVNRIDLRVVRALRDAAQVRLAQARNGTLPSLAITAGWTSASTGIRTSAVASDMRTSSAWRLGVSLGAPLLNRADRGQELLASTQVDIETIRVRSAEAQVVREVRTTVRALRMGGERAEVASRAAALAWEQLTAERRRLELGLGDSFRLLQTEDGAVQSQLEAVRARYNMLRANASYRLAIGTAPVSP